MKLIRVYSVLLVALVLSLDVPVYAATTTTTFQVTATINNTCSISATDLAFGTYDPTSVSDNTSTITVTCTATTGYSIGLDAGTASGATVTTRQMSDGASGLLNYSLFSDVSRTTNWGNTVNSDTVNVGSATGSSEAHTVFGRIPSGQFAQPGSYSDTITVTITY